MNWHKCSNKLPRTYYNISDEKYSENILLSNGTEIFLGRLTEFPKNEKKWVIINFNGYHKLEFDDITHWAKITLPEDK